jgi:hypothetical protein
MKAPIKTIPELEQEFDFTLVFLLGMISTKWWIDHNKKRIRIYLPITKRYLATKLKANWGGSISNVNRKQNRGVIWQASSTRSFTKIREAAIRLRPWLPPEFHDQLTSFLNAHI